MEIVVNVSVYVISRNVSGSFIIVYLEVYNA